MQSVLDFVTVHFRRTSTLNPSTPSSLIHDYSFIWTIYFDRRLSDLDWTLFQTRLPLYQKKTLTWPADLIRTQLLFTNKFRFFVEKKLKFQIWNFTIITKVYSCSINNAFIVTRFLFALLSFS